jgi:hypothetical protein
VGSGQHLQQCPDHSPARQAEANRLGHNPLFPLLFHPTFLLSAFLLFFFFKKKYELFVADEWSNKSTEI